jgi:pyruvate dehydrogenase E2 component (dihydrolipoamide acetyltransferase)
LILAKEIIMPALGMAQETGILLQWLKAEGDDVTQGESLMEIETDKAAVEVEAPASGILSNVTAAPGDEVPVGQVIALILAPGEEAPAAKSPAATATDASPTNSEPKVLVSPLAARIAGDHNVDLAQVAAGGSRIQKEDVLAHLAVRQEGESADGYRLTPASPKARRLAGENNLDVISIDGSGPNGAVLAADVLAAAKAQTTQPAIPTPAMPVPTDASELPISRMWQVMAQRLTQSWTSVPHFYLAREANAGQLLAWRMAVMQRVAEKVTFTDLLVKLVALAIRRNPRLNASWHNGSIVQNPVINIGLAVAVDDGLLVPVIPNADQLSLSDIAARRKALVKGAQTGKLSPAQMSGGTFTISNLGMFGIDAFNAIVNPPEAAILALGRIAERVVPINGQPAVQPMMSLTLSCDHRVVDGARGAQFIQTLVNFIEDPLAVLD